jgi:hypothetical protein
VLLPFQGVCIIGIIKSRRKNNDFELLFIITPQQ